MIAAARLANELCEEQDLSQSLKKGFHESQVTDIQDPVDQHNLRPT